MIIRLSKNRITSAVRDKEIEEVICNSGLVSSRPGKVSQSDSRIRFTDRLGRTKIVSTGCNTRSMLCQCCRCQGYASFERCLKISLVCVSRPLVTVITAIER